MILDQLILTTDWTNESLAAAVGSSGATISRLRTNTRDASLALAIAIEVVSEGAVTVNELPISDYSRRWWKRWLGEVGL